MKTKIPAGDIANKLAALAEEVKPSALGTAGFLYSLAGWLQEGGNELVVHKFKTLLNPQQDYDRLTAKMALAASRKNEESLDA